MDDELSCPVCQTDDHLRGERDGEAIHITCSGCGHSWNRDLTPRCRRCGRTDVHAASQAVWEKARGTQLSIVSVQTVYLCPDCDRDKYARVRESNTPLPPDDNPAADLR